MDACRLSSEGEFFLGVSNPATTGSNYTGFIKLEVIKKSVVHGAFLLLQNTVLPVTNLPIFVGKSHLFRDWSVFEALGGV